MSTLAGPAAPMMGVSHHHHHHQSHHQAVLAAAYFHNNNQQNIGINSSSAKPTNGGFASPERTSPVDVQPDRPIGYGAFGVVW